jgi:hypothetical protein
MWIDGEFWETEKKHPRLFLLGEEKKNAVRTL